MRNLKQKILLGITGSIAAYKTPELIRLLQKANFSVKVILTQQGSQFVTPLTLQTLCQHAVYAEQNYQLSADWGIQHIELARWAERILIAPASANVIAKLAQGLCDDLLTTTCLATRAPMIIVPAMNPMMWQHPATQHNIQILKNRGVEFLGPAVGEHACHETGLGRMLEPNDIVSCLLSKTARRELENYRILITAGPTYEAIDPVRFLGNHSSGKMGYALVQAALQQGAKVTLISGPTALTPPDGATVIQVTTAHEMQNAVEQHIAAQDIIISTAAVSDYYYPNFSQQKIKKQVGIDTWSLEFKKNPDIIAEIKKQHPKVFCVGFAAETENLIDNAIDKIKSKNLDMVIANLIHPDYGMGKEDNAVVVMDKALRKTEFPCENKQSLAAKLITCIARACLD